MGENIIVLSVPIFFGLMAIEIVAVRLLRKDYYRMGDAISSISCGMIAQVLEAAVSLAPALALYAFVAKLAPVQLDKSSVWTWVLAIVGVDFLFYWWHRTSHEVNFFWAAHVVHHQSEDYNLSTALRQTWPTSVTSAFFYLPIAFLGVPFDVYFTAIGIGLLYQYWIHTRLIGKLGPLEWVLNTPSHHRVHHGVNPEYVDKNYAAILIVWDRMFGTFAEERAAVVYGTVKPANTWNPIASNLLFWRELVGRTKASRGLREKLRHWVVSPEWMPTDPRPKLVLEEYRPSGYQKYEVSYGAGKKALVFGLFILLLVGTAVYLNHQQDFEWWARLAIALVITSALGALSRVGVLRSNRG